MLNWSPDSVVCASKNDAVDFPVIEFLHGLQLSHRSGFQPHLPVGSMSPNLNELFEVYL